MENLYLERIVSGIWSGYIVASDRGLCYVSHVHDNLSDVVDWQLKNYPNSKLVSSSPKIEPYKQQFYEYLEGTRAVFDFPIDVNGTPFQKEVWAALYEIPYGSTASYLDIARMIGRDYKSAQAVGRAVGSNPICIVCPCHRIVGEDGSLTGYSGGLEAKKKLLNHEIQYFAQHRNH